MFLRWQRLRVTQRLQSTQAPLPQLQICPDNLKYPPQWDHVLYEEDPTTSARAFDRKRCPIDLPHPDLEFGGYVLDDNRSKISAYAR